MMRSKTNRRLLIAAVLSAAVIPLLNTTVLGSIYIYVISDITYPELLSEVIGYASELLATACVFAFAACIACSAVRERNQKIVPLIGFISVPVLYIAVAIVDYSFYAGSAVNASYVIFNLLNCIFELARLAVVTLICLLAAKRARRKNRIDSLELFSAEGALSRAVIFSALAVFVSLIITDLTETVPLLAQYGAPVNTNELIYLILPYPTSIVYSLLGYLLMYVVASGIYRTKKPKERKSDAK